MYVPKRKGEKLAQEESEAVSINENNRSGEPAGGASNIIRFPTPTTADSPAVNAGGGAAAFDETKTKIEKAGAASAPASQPQIKIQLETLNDEQLEQYSLNLLLVTKIENGMKVREAARAVNWNKSYRSAYDLWERYQFLGKAGLIDRRWLRETETKVLTQQVKLIAYGWYLERRAAGPRAIWELTAETCRQNKLPVPAETTVKTYLNNLTPNEKLARKGAAGFKEIHKQNASVHEQKDRTSYANELWQGDHTELDVWARRWLNNKWTACEVYLSALLDAHSRAITAILVSLKSPDTWSIALLYRKAIMPKDNSNLNVWGLPANTESDRGADWISNDMRLKLSALGINAIVDPPNHPNSKGKVERWFGHLNSSCLAKLPGNKNHVGRSLQAAQKAVLELPTFETVKREIEIWTASYNQKIHGETNRKPLEFWQETVRLREPESEDQLNILLLKYDLTRTILNCGVRVVIGKEKHRYWSPAFDQLIKRRVHLRYNPEDTESVWFHCADTNKFLCEAWDMRAAQPRYGLADIKVARKQEVLRLRGLVERTRNYMKTVTPDDRLAETEKHWQAVRETAAELRTAAEAKRAAQEVEAARNKPEIVDLAEELRLARRKQQQ